MIVAIDGPSGAGKSTIAAAVAKIVGFQLIDTGAIYRSLTYLADEASVDLKDEKAVAAFVKELDFSFAWQNGENVVLVNGKPLGDEIRTEAVSKKTSQVAAFPMVRAALLEIQRQLGLKSSSILEGRDIGSVVFPNAEVKVYLDASAKVRAERRAAQAAERGEFVDVAILQKMIEERDARDKAREVAPLVCPKEAYRIDATALSVDEVVDRVVSLVKKKESR